MYPFSDESMLRDIKHPGHTSGGREAVGVALVICILSFIGFTAFDVSFIPLEVKIGLTILVAGLAFWGVLRLFKKLYGGKSKGQAEKRADMQAETERRIEAAKASGAFDKWDQK